MSLSNVDRNSLPYLMAYSGIYIAFDGLPKLIKPKEGSKLFELRTYEGYSEDAVRRKVKMFNEEEFAIFDEAFSDLWVNVGKHSHSRKVARQSWPTAQAELVRRASIKGFAPDVAVAAG